SYTFGVIIGGFSTDIYLLLIARTFQGIGISFIPVAYSIIKDIFPVKRMAIAQSIFTSMFAFGSVLGILLGGSIIQYYGWNMTFYSLIPVTIVIVIVVGRLSHKIERGDYQDEIKEKQKTEPIPKSIDKPYHKNRIQIDKIKRIVNTIDIKGTLLLAVFLTSFFLLLTSFENSSNNTNGNAYSDLFNLERIILLAITIVTILLFVYVELKNKDSKLIDLRLLTNKLILIPNLLSLIVGFWIFTLFYTIPILAKNPLPVGLGITSVDTSFLLLPYGVVVLIFGPSSGYIISKFGSTSPVLVGTIISLIGFIMFLFFYSIELLLSISLLIVAIGISLTTIGSINVVMLYTPKQSSGMSFAITSLLKLLGSAIGPALAAVFLENFQYSVPIDSIIKYLPSAESYNLIFLTSVIVSIMAISLAILLRHYTKQQVVRNP
ncbi:MAG: MFS transporter, partial [Nitrososphaeraceae archaeon]